jgi:rsbT co-antagonist protein RsbR
MSLPSDTESKLPDLLRAHEAALLASWTGLLSTGGGPGGGRLREGELRGQCASILSELIAALAAGGTDTRGEPYEALREALDTLSHSRASQGFSPRDVATFIFSLKQPLFRLAQSEYAGNAGQLGETIWLLTRLLDDLGLHTVESFQRAREDIIARQQQEISELSTPVVSLWRNILALPLIGTLDSSRTQVVMENLLQAIVDQQAEIAIIDITGVPTVDTLVAQYLIKTVSAARLMGADCIISGIRPQIAQTMVHLGVELNVTTKATLAGALAVALQRTGQIVTKAPARS